MGADNWGICPRCKAKEVVSIQKFAAEVYGSYGKVSLQEYQKNHQRLQEMLKPKLAPDRTFREDYSIGTSEDGIFEVSYTGSCQVCGFHHNFKHTEDLIP